MAYPEPKPLNHQKRSNSWKKAVVYDPANHVLCTQTEEDLKGSLYSSPLYLQTKKADFPFQGRQRLTQSRSPSLVVA